MQVGKRNKVAVTRQAGGARPGEGAGPRTAINLLFSGATKSVIKSGAAKVRPCPAHPPSLALLLVAREAAESEMLVTFSCSRVLCPAAAERHGGALHDAPPGH